MHKALPLVTLMLAAAAAVSGCSTIGPKEMSRVGTTYELTQPWCHAEFGDGTSELTPGKCVTVVRPVNVKVELRPGTCLKLGEPRVSYPEFRTAVLYDVDIAGLSSTISTMDSPGRPWSQGLVRGSCTPEKAPVAP